MEHKVVDMQMCIHVHVCAYTHIFFTIFNTQRGMQFSTASLSWGLYIFATSHFRAQIKGNPVPAVSEVTVCNLKGTQTAPLGEGTPYVP